MGRRRKVRRTLTGTAIDDFIPQKGNTSEEFNAGDISRHRIGNTDVVDRVRFRSDFQTIVRKMRNPVRVFGGKRKLKNQRKKGLAFDLQISDGKTGRRFPKPRKPAKRASKPTKLYSGTYDKFQFWSRFFFLTKGQPS